MPIYENLCSECGYGFDHVQSIKANALITCPECGQDTLRRVLHAVTIFTRGDAVTVAQQADRNTSSMGRYELEAKRHAHAEAGEKSREAMGLSKRPKAERPFWRKTDKVNTDLAKLAPNVTIEKGKITKSEPLSEKAKDYIMTGNK
jgi:putative FmdB family regulatory protein